MCVVNQPKSNGGLGFKRPHHMNEAFLMKMMWNLIKKPDELWCRVLLSKYSRNNDLMVSCRSQPYDSPLWKALAGVWNDFHRHVFWKIGDGRQTNFSLDKWIPNVGELFSSASLNLIDTTLSVRDAQNSEGGWNLNFLRDNLANNIVNQVLALPDPNNGDGPDTMGWEGSNTHQFTVQSAYLLQFGDILTQGGDWKSLWDWEGPHRIQTFIWMAVQERILTNLRRSKWGVGISPLCTRCGRDDETMIHVLRDCIYSIQVWLHLVPSNFITDFFTFDCRNWNFNNINKLGIGANISSWKTTFLTTCCDGACKRGGESSGYGGIFRKSDRRWVKDYIKKIGLCDAFYAELWGMYLGLDMAWKERIPQLIAENDSKILIDIVTDNYKFRGVVATLVQRIRNLIEEC
ncbi:hypothetical protein TSUD_54010 [Trifolium subterraneum]|uniref:Reverse transcriptase zinc-binding domain-containing protein n=1 Tax=Trifolium subterraneum TaxID=3900 RepID=A0A2Z6MHU8_TRISU|nr:hypothetical protein TSUD_54010 [Trifolium subterraneum]